MEALKTWGSNAESWKDVGVRLAGAKPVGQTTIDDALDHTKQNLIRGGAAATALLLTTVILTSSPELMTILSVGGLIGEGYARMVAIPQQTAAGSAESTGETKTWANKITWSNMVSLFRTLGVMGGFLAAWNRGSWLLLALMTPGVCLFEAPEAIRDVKAGLKPAQHVE